VQRELTRGALQRVVDTVHRLTTFLQALHQLEYGLSEDAAVASVGDLDDGQQPAQAKSRSGRLERASALRGAVEVARACALLFHQQVSNALGALIRHRLRELLQDIGSQCLLCGARG